MTWEHMPCDLHFFFLNSIFNNLSVPSTLKVCLSVQKSEPNKVKFVLFNDATGTH